MMPLKDLEARREYRRKRQKERYSNDPKFKEKHLLFVRNSDEKRKEISRALIAEFRKNGCFACGEMEYCCLSAHHKDPSQKDLSVGDAIREKKNPKLIEAELAKCVCLCMNCHAKVHAGIIEITV